MQNPLFRQYVNTRQHGTTVTGEGGYERNIVWKNTNKLLAIDGYSGVKTGTTTAAGACLVSWGERDGRELHRRRPRRHPHRRPLRRCPQPLPLGLATTVGQAASLPNSPRHAEWNSTPTNHRRPASP